MKMPMGKSLKAQIAAIEAERKAIFKDIKPKNRRLVTLYKARGKLMEQYAKTLTDYSTDEGLRELVDVAWDDGAGTRAGGDLLTAFAKGYAPEVYSVEYQEHGKRIYPVPKIMLTQNQDVARLARQLLALLRRMALGRTVVSVSLFEHTLSEHGSYEIEVTVASGQAKLCMTRYGHRSTLSSGSLEDILTECARDHWYERAGGEDEDE